MSGFPRRIRQHDEDALPVVIERLKAYSFDCFVMGTESDSDDLHKALMGQSDRTSIMLRFRPDRVFIKRGVRSLLCEVKSESKGHYNFAIEVDSYRATHEWNMMHHHVMYAFVDLSDGEPIVSCCWADDVLGPRKIFVPKRWDYRESLARLGREFPSAVMETTKYYPGNQSGTPYFLISKKSPYLRPFDEFMSSVVEMMATQLELIGVS